MLDRLIGDVRRALDANCYFAALALALALPDICGKAEYPKESNKKRYIKWYDEYIGQYENPPSEDGEVEMPYLSGEVVYNLRNSLIHQGTPNINKGKIKDERNQIDYFALKLEPKNKFDDSYNDCVTFTDKCYGNNAIRTYEVSVRRLCFILCRCSEVYYNTNKEKFDFWDFHIVGEETDKSEYLPF